MIKQTHEMPDIPAALRRQTNAKGVTLSAGVVATGARTAKKTPQVEAIPGTAPLGIVAKSKAARKDSLDQTAKLATRAAAKVVKEAAPKSERVAKARLPKAPKLPKQTKTTAEPALGPDGQPLEKVSRSIVPMKFKARYAANAGTCGDDMALELKAATTTRNADKREVLDVEALWAIAKANTIDVAKYVDLNNGQKRMNVGNKLRGRLAAGEDVIIGKRKFKAEDFQPRH